MALKVRRVEHVVDPDSKDNYGRTLLSWATENGQERGGKIATLKGRCQPGQQDGQPQPWLAACWKGECMTAREIISQRPPAHSLIRARPSTRVSGKQRDACCLLGSRLVPPKS